MPTTLEIKDLHASIEGKQILKGVTLTVSQGEIHAIMGPNGSGKSTLANTLMGHPKYKVDSGDILVNGESIVGMPPDQRAKRGLFLAFQYPIEISGVPLAQFLRSSYRSIRGETKSDAKGVGGEMITALAFKKKLEEKLKEVDMDPAFSKRYLNEGFSGGEKKRAEVLQMAILQPAIAIMDETDSGLDIDAVRKVAEVVAQMAGPQMGVLLITHYQRILEYIRPQFVHVMANGRIFKSGGPDLAKLLEEKGYAWIEQEAAVAV
ncbi:MAG TPA: Fe-S cluster assembly ATPase SufC [Candidatus Acidoferrales bacterium]|nr:Fe-S cluster assembly ATPase SufC [Candidatus Acidoferrales bacterium]